MADFKRFLEFSDVGDIFSVFLQIETVEMSIKQKDDFATHINRAAKKCQGLLNALAKWRENGTKPICPPTIRVATNADSCLLGSKERNNETVF